MSLVIVRKSQRTGFISYIQYFINTKIPGFEEKHL